MKYFSMFSGIGGFERGINEAYLHKYESKKSEQANSTSRGERDSDERGVCVLLTDNAPLCIGYSEIDKYAIQIYEKHFGGQCGIRQDQTQSKDSTDSQGRASQLPGCSLHNGELQKGHKNYGDATRIVPEEIPDFDLLVGGFPCQAFSIAGKRAGFDDTRGTLFFEIARILKHKRPRYFLLENVKGLLSHDSGKTFQTILKVCSDIGYRVQWQVLNSKDFGVPQNRERVFIIGHLRGTSRPEVFPITESSQSNLKYSGGVISAREQWLKDGKTNSRNFSQGQRIYDKSGISQTLAGNAGGQGGKTGLYDSGIGIRRLTPIECERLQGFPDGWTEGISDSQRYKCLGNAVTVNVIQAIMERLLNPHPGD